MKTKKQKLYSVPDLSKFEKSIYSKRLNCSGDAVINIKTVKQIAKLAGLKNPSVYYSYGHPYYEILNINCEIMDRTGDNPKEEVQNVFKFCIWVSHYENKITDNEIDNNRAETETAAKEGYQEREAYIKSIQDYTE